MAMCSVLIVSAIGASERRKKGVSNVTNMEIQQAAKDENFLNAIGTGISRRAQDELSTYT